MYCKYTTIINYFYATGEGHPSKGTCDDVKRLTSALCDAQKDNPMVIVGQAFSEIQNKNYTIAKDLLTGRDL